jgi:WD40 repeat protein
MIALAQGEKWSLFDLEEGAEIYSVETGEPITEIKFHPDGLIMSTGHENGNVKLWDIRTQAIIQTLHGDSPVRKVVFSNKGYHLAASWDTCVKLFDMRKGFGATDIAFEGACSLSFDEYGSYLMVSDGSSIGFYAGK